MIRRAVPVVLILCVSPQIVSSDTVRVQSGDHSNFARLVFVSRNLSDWTITQSAGGYVFSTSNSEASFDTRRIFEKISQERVAKVSELDGGDLFLEVACECHIDAFEIPAGVVVDIVDGPPDGVSDYVFAERESIATPVVSQTVDYWGLPGSSYQLDVPISERMLETRDLTALGQQEQSQTEPMGDAAENPPSASQFTTGEQGDIPLDPSGLGALSESLLSQLSRAAENGFAEIDLRSSTFTTLEPSTDGTSIGGASVAPQLAVRSAVDVENLLIQTDETATTDDSGCVDDSLLNLNAWGTAKSPTDPLSIAHGALLEGATLEEDISFPLAKKMLFLTFGAEARALLAPSEGEVAEAAILSAIADIMDKGASESDAFPPSMLECDGRAALWALLSGSSSDSSRDAPLEITYGDSVLRAFRELPRHLKTHLGPMLIERFIEFDDTVRAEAILIQLESTHDGSFPELKIARAELDRHVGNTGESLEELEGIFRGNSLNSVSATIDLVDDGIDEEAELPPKTLEALEALSYEFRNDPLGPEIERTRFRSKIAAGDYLDAGLELASPPDDSGLSIDVRTNLLLEVVDAIMEAQDDPQLIQLTHMVQRDVWQKDILAPKIEGIAQRLAAIGLPTLARALLDGFTVTLDEPGALALTKAMLDAGEPAQALELLDGLSSIEAMSLAAVAHRDLGNADLAIKLLKDAGDTGQARSLEWRNQFWEEARNSNDERGQIAEIAAAVPASDPDVTLENALQQVESSADQRSKIRDLLKALE